MDTLKWQWEQRLIPYWTEQGKIAADHGVTLCFEMQVADLLNNPVKLRRFHKEISPVVACNFDISHMWAQSIDPISALRYLGPLVQYVHLKDTYINDYNVSVKGMNDTTSTREPAERAWTFTQPGGGHGESTWCEVMATFRFIGYDDILSLEMECEWLDVKEAIEKSVDFLKPIMLEQPAEPKWWEHANWRMRQHSSRESS